MNRERGISWEKNTVDRIAVGNDAPYEVRYSDPGWPKSRENSTCPRPHGSASVRTVNAA